MHRYITEALDNMAIRNACRSIPQVSSVPCRAAEARAFVAREDFLDCRSIPVADLNLSRGPEFHFSTPQPSPWPSNNRVFGRFYRAGNDWQRKPSVLLLHGWNGELGYQWQFPYLAWRMNQAGLNAAMIELPYHGQRTPTEPGAIRNFLSHDLLNVAQAVQQAVSESCACFNWLIAQGSPAIGLWGVSLGGWLSGLITCQQSKITASVLMTPLCSMTRALRELQFCAPIRRRLADSELDLSPLDLASRRFTDAPTRVLIVGADYDLFAPRDTLIQLWDAWQRPEYWHYPHGHISILGSLPIMERTVHWLRDKLYSCVATAPLVNPSYAVAP